MTYDDSTAVSLVDSLAAAARLLGGDTRFTNEVVTWTGHGAPAQVGSGDEALASEDVTALADVKRQEVLVTVLRTIEGIGAGLGLGGVQDWSGAKAKDAEAKLTNLMDGLTREQRQLRWAFEGFAIANANAGVTQWDIFACQVGSDPPGQKDLGKRFLRDLSLLASTWTNAVRVGGQTEFARTRENPETGVVSVGTGPAEGWKGIHQQSDTTLPSPTTVQGGR